MPSRLPTCAPLAPPSASSQDLGTLLISDLLVAWLYEMQERLAKEPASASASSPRYAMPNAIADLARYHYRTRCFGVSFEQTLKIIESKALGSEQEREALAKFKNASGDFFGGTANEGQYNQGMHSLPPLKASRGAHTLILSLSLPPPPSTFPFIHLSLTLPLQPPAANTPK